MKKSALVLLSSGLDSLTALAQAVKDCDVQLAITFNYGQRAARAEIKNAKKAAAFYGIKHQTIKLNLLRNVTDTALVNKKKKIPLLHSAKEGNQQSALQVWVPNRNGLFLNIAAAIAESQKIELLITGFNREEAATFPDNSLAFCKAANKFFSFSTLNKVKVKNYFYNKNKKQILAQALKNKVPLQYLWSCYYGGRKFCGQCESCQRLKQALLENKQLTQIAKKIKKYRGLL